MAEKRSKLTLGTKNKKIKMCVTNSDVNKNFGLNDVEIKNRQTGAEYVPASVMANKAEADDNSIMRGDNRGVQETTECRPDPYLDSLQLALQDFPWSDGTCLPDLPPFVSATQTISDKEDRWWLTSTAGSDGVVSVDEWTPLPAMCSHCRRRKTSQSLDKFILTSVSLNDKNLDSCHNNPLPNFDMISNLNKSRLGDDQRTQIVGASSVSINQKNAVCNAPRKTTNSSSLSAPVSKSINPLSSKSICPVNASTNKQVSNMTKKKMPVNPSSGKVSSKIVMKSQSIMQSFGKSKVDSSQRTHTIENREVNDVNAAVTNDLQCCPLCQKQFEARMSQLDRDGHIAACLSSSAEDVNW